MPVTILSKQNFDGVALPSAVRNVAGGFVDSPDIIAENVRGIVGFLNITSTPGSATLSARFQWRDPASGNYADVPRLSAGDFFPFTLTVSTSQMLLFQVGNIQSDGVGTTVSNIIARTLRIRVFHSAPGNFTYSVGYSLMP